MMFFLQYKALPLPGKPNAGKHGGAIVNCWVGRASAVEAEIVAKQMIEAEGWQVWETLEVREANQAHCGLGEGARQYFEQAQLDGEVLVFFTFPNEHSDAEEVEGN